MSAVTAINASAPELPREQPPQKRRGGRGELGEGTRSDRVKSAWRKWKKASDKDLPLRQWARRHLAEALRLEEEGIGRDLDGWLGTKTHVRTPEKRAAMKEAKSRKRSKPKKPSKDRRRVKGNSGKR